MMHLRRLFLAVLAGGLLFGVLAVPNASAVGSFSTVVAGLDNPRDSPHSTSPTTVTDGLSFPGGFAPGSDGSLYVSDWSTAPAVTGMGAVVRIVP